MKFGTQNRSSLLILNRYLKIAGLDPELKTWGDMVSKLQCVSTLMKIAMCFNFNENWR